MPKNRKPYFMPRKFGGKTYKYHAAYATKTSAKEHAKELQKQGYLVRIAGDYDWGGRGYNIYKRRKK